MYQMCWWLIIICFCVLFLRARIANPRYRDKSFYLMRETKTGILKEN